VAVRLQRRGLGRRHGMVRNAPPPPGPLPHPPPSRGAAPIPSVRSGKKRECPRLWQ
jgi:hypothetical protein